METLNTSPAEQTEILGYTLEKIAGDDGTSGRLAYLLHGPRGARYGLVRAIDNPVMLYAWNDRSFGVVSIKGYGWFTDFDGRLVPVNR
jgi:hypothetical protein